MDALDDRLIRASGDGIRREHGEPRPGESGPVKADYRVVGKGMASIEAFRAVCAACVRHVEGNRPGVLAEMGFSQARLDEINPRLIVASINGYGSAGPYADRPSFDFIAQAMSGFMATTGEKDGAPMRAGAPITDLIAGLYCAFGVVNAIRARELTGRGQRVQTSLLQAVLALQSGLVVDYPGHEVVYRNTPTYRLYQAGDGHWFFLACGNQAFWAKLCKAIGRPELTDDPRFGSWLLRGDNRESLMPILEAAFKTKSRDEWLKILSDHDIPCAAVQSLPEFMRDPGVQHLQMTVQYEHPEVGALTLMGQPIRFSETQAPDAGPPPVLGQHTRAVLRELGYQDGDIADLHRRGVIAGKDL